MINALEILRTQVDEVFAVRVARYIFEQGSMVLECFEDGWDWTLSLEALEQWINKP